MRWLAAAGTVLLLGACSGTPRKAAAPDAAPAARPAPATAAGARRSPYAPAQEDPGKRGDYVAGGLYAPHIRDSAPDYIPDVDAIPEPEVVDEPRSAYGNRSPYQVLGKSYHVLDDTTGFSERGRASYYGNKFHGRRTSNLEVYDMYAFTAAHKSLPLPSFARVTNLENGRSVVVRVNDRGPFHEGRVVDLSWAAAVKLDMHRAGTAEVEVVALSPGENARHEAGRYAQALPPAAPELATPATATPPAASAIDRVVAALPMASAHAGERPALAATTGVTPAPAGEWRFDMHQNGRAMTAGEFDAWMKERQIRVATGRPATPPPRAVDAPAAAGPPAAAPVSGGAAVILQVAAFGTRDNAERALSMLRGAGVGEAQLVDGLAAGKPVWRLRVGPVASHQVADVTARCAGLGFGQPQIVRE
ncbi:hypothetical protein CO641_08360 [Lysobacteraceae bacterium NML91-0213]|nr:hypothetical protein CO641_08360 [Xanthomonadaceae bacterium NML91-0213]